MKTSHLLPLGALTLLTTTLAFAQPVRPVSSPGLPPPPSPLLRLFDSNRDGVIDAEEISAATNVLLSYDRNNDGVLTPRELLPPLPAARARQLPPPPPPGGPRLGPDAAGPLALFDTNHDGVLSLAEMEAAVAMLTSLDQNGDGQLTPDELPPPPVGHRPGGRAPAARNATAN